MASKVEEVLQKELVPKGSIPTWLKKSVEYEAITGSISYGCASDMSDFDVVGFCVPPKAIVFPHTDGKLIGFDNLTEFGQWQQHHIHDPDALKGRGRTYDFTIYSIIKYFKLCMDNNPNMVDSLFVPGDCVLHCTPLAGMVRSKREIFLHKGAYHKFTGYLHSQIAKLERKPIGKRKESFEKWGYDLKYLMHAVRLASEVEQILEFGSLDLRRDSEMYKAIRRGDWTLDQGRKWLLEKEANLTRLYASSNLRNTPAKDEIKQLLLDCLEAKFGSLEKCEFTNPDKFKTIVEQIREIVQ